MGESVPVSIGRQEPPARSDVTEVTAPGAAIGHAAAAMLGHLAAVLDREDRLESGSGEWLAGFAADSEAGRAAVLQSVLRALGLASDPTNFAILTVLAGGNPQRMDQLVAATGLTELSVAERVSDLVSAGLATKLPSANQVVGTQAGAAIVALVTEAVEAGARELGAR